MDVSIIIVNYNTKDLTVNCIKSVYSSATKYSYEIILVDNCSSDSSVSSIKTLFPEVQIIENKQNAGFAKANNQAANKAIGRYLYVLNSDTEIEKDVIDKVVTYGDLQPGVGVIGTKVCYSNGELQKTFLKFSTFLSELIFFSIGIIKSNDWFIFNLNKYNKYKLHEPFGVDIISGCSMFVKREVYEKTGLFNEDFFMYYEDNEFCYRVKKNGFLCVYFPIVNVKHFHKGSSKSNKYNFKTFKYSFNSACIYFKYVKNSSYAYIFRITVYLIWYVELVIFMLSSLAIKDEKLTRKIVMLKTLLNDR